MGYWLGTGIAPPTTHPATHTPGTPPPHRAVPPGMVQRCTGMYGGVNSVVGLKSVHQLSLYVLFSGFLGMTEVYNLRKIGRINNHYDIPGTK